MDTLSRHITSSEGSLVGYFSLVSLFIVVSERTYQVALEGRYFDSVENWTGVWVFVCAMLERVIDKYNNKKIVGFFECIIIFQL